MGFWRRLMGGGGQDGGGQGGEHWRPWPLPGLSDEAQTYLQRALEIVEQHVNLQHYPEIVSMDATGGEGTIMEAAREVERALEVAPDHPGLLYIHASLLAVALQGASATEELKALQAAHPDYWLADVALRAADFRCCPATWTPWPDEGGSLHPGVLRHLQTIVDEGFRMGLMPLAAVLTRVPSSEQVTPQEFLRLPLELAVVDSGLRKPTVTAFVFRLGEAGPDALIMEMLGRPLGSYRSRMQWELLCRQPAFPLVNVQGDEIVGIRWVEFGPRSRAAAEALAETLASTDLEEESLEEFLAAVRLYQQAFAIEALPFERVA